MRLRLTAMGFVNTANHESRRLPSIRMRLSVFVFVMFSLFPDPQSSGRIVFEAACDGSIVCQLSVARLTPVHGLFQVRLPEPATRPFRRSQSRGDRSFPDI